MGNPGDPSKALATRLPISGFVEVSGRMPELVPPHMAASVNWGSFLRVSLE